MKQLYFVGQQTADFLTDHIEEQLDRYVEGDFLDLEEKGDWRIPLSIRADLDALAQLDPSGTPEAEVANSQIVGNALSHLTPSLARENRIWIRLSHVEALEYSRRRWLAVRPEHHARNVRLHFFAPAWNACRDDHAISRLWWNWRIATLLMPEKPEAALAIILERADIRLNFIERARAAARLPLARAMLRALIDNPDVRRSERAFREFMKAINFNAAGQTFEALRPIQIARLIDSCLTKAGREAAATQTKTAHA